MRAMSLYYFVYFYDYYYSRRRSVREFLGKKKKNQSEHFITISAWRAAAAVKRDNGVNANGNRDVKCRRREPCSVINVDDRNKNYNILLSRVL